MRLGRCGAIVGSVAVALVVCGSQSARSAVGIEAPATSKRAFQVLPKEHPATGYTQKSRFDLRRPVVVKSGRANAQIRKGLMQALAILIAGMIGLIVLSFRIYGRLQGRAAR
jgi:hypothetical protein